MAMSKPDIQGTNLSKIKNINAGKLIKKGGIFLSSSQKREIRKAKNDIDNANKEIGKASDDSKEMEYEMNDAFDDMDEGENFQSEIDSKLAENASEDDIGNIQSDAEQEADKLEDYGSLLDETTETMASDAEDFSDTSEEGSEELESINSELEQLTSEIEADTAEMESQSAGNSDAAGGGAISDSAKYSATSLKTGAEIEQEKASQKNYESFGSQSSVSNDSDNSGILASLQAINEKTNRVSELQGQAQTLNDNMAAQATEKAETLTATQENATAIQEEGNEKLSAIEVTENVLAITDEIANVTQTTGKLTKVVGTGLQAAGWGIETTGGTLTGVGGGLVGVGASLISTGSPLCAIFGIGAPIEAAGITTTSSGSSVTSTGTTLTSTGLALGNAGKTTQLAGEVTEEIGQGLGIATHAAQTVVLGVQGKWTDMVSKGLGVVTDSLSFAGSVMDTAGKFAEEADRAAQFGEQAKSAADKAKGIADAQKSVKHSLSVAKKGLDFGAKGLQLGVAIENGGIQGITTSAIGLAGSAVSFGAGFAPADEKGNYTIEGKIDKWTTASTNFATGAVDTGYTYKDEGWEKGLMSTLQTGVTTGMFVYGAANSENEENNKDDNGNQKIGKKATAIDYVGTTANVLNDATNLTMSIINKDTAGIVNNSLGLVADTSTYYRPEDGDTANFTGLGAKAAQVLFQDAMSTKGSIENIKSSSDNIKNGKSSETASSSAASTANTTSSSTESSKSKGLTDEQKAKLARISGKYKK